ncbi:MAG: squalene--hopene cyclase [Desulfuromonadaceae bacterium]
MNTHGHTISQTLTSFNGIAGVGRVSLGSPVSSVKPYSLPVSLQEENRELVKNSPLDRAIERSCAFFFREQLPEGYWWAELESNVTITAEYIMLFRFLGIVTTKEQKMANYILGKQTTEGAWTLWPGGPGDLSTTIEAYFALKITGYSEDHPAMSKAREFILANGGIFKSRVFTKIFLALFGEFSWLGVPSMPVELMLLPNWAYFNAYELSSWSRSTIIPLSVVMAERPVRGLPPWARVQELYICPPRLIDYTITRENGILTWKNFFIGVDHLLKVYEANPIRPLKKKAIDKAKQWVLDHQEASGDCGGIQPAMLNAILALHCLGYDNKHPVILKGLRALENFSLENKDTLCLQSCVSPVWDTALVLKALQDAGVPKDHPALINAAEWLIDREIRTPGDWKVKSPDLRPGGWAFEFNNDRYPDVDDSAVVMMAIKDVAVRNGIIKDNAIRRGFAWCIGMQSRNGGWGAFDRNNTKHILNKIPFADLEALIDPPTADLTARMLELMGTFGCSCKSHPAAVRALQFVRESQEADGSWWGRWGVNYIYGTWSVLSGLAAIGEDMKQPWIEKAVAWLIIHQNPDGGWGETCESYSKPALAGIGESTASQTGWALLALMAAGNANSVIVCKGINYLLETQNPDGSWDEEAYTGTGFPKYFMIKYHIYRNCFPLMALGKYRTLTKGAMPGLSFTSGSAVT